MSDTKLKTDEVDTSTIWTVQDMRMAIAEIHVLRSENAAMREAIGEAHVFIERHTYSDHAEDCLTMCGPDAECDCGQFKERRETLSKLQPFLKP